MCLLIYLWKPLYISYCILLIFLFLLFLHYIIINIINNILQYNHFFYYYIFQNNKFQKQTKIHNFLITYFFSNQPINLYFSSQLKNFNKQ